MCFLHKFNKRKILILYQFQFQEFQNFNEKTTLPTDLREEIV